MDETTAKLRDALAALIPFAESRAEDLTELADESVEMDSYESIQDSANIAWLAVENARDLLTGTASESELAYKVTLTRAIKRYASATVTVDAADDASAFRRALERIDGGDLWVDMEHEDSAGIDIEVSSLHGSVSWRTDVAGGKPVFHVKHWLTARDIRPIFFRHAAFFLLTRSAFCITFPSSSNGDHDNGLPSSYHSCRRLLHPGFRDFRRGYLGGLQLTVQPLSFKSRTPLPGSGAPKVKRPRGGHAPRGRESPCAPTGPPAGARPSRPVCKNGNPYTTKNSNIYTIKNTNVYTVSPQK